MSVSMTFTGRSPWSEIPNPNTYQIPNKSQISNSKAAEPQKGHSKRNTGSERNLNDQVLCNAK